MMEYMREGGFAMWAILVTGVLAVVLAATRPAAARPGVLMTGSIAAIVQGMLGLSSGLLMVSRNYQRFPNPMEAIGAGLGEASHNGTFGALVATLLGLAALITARQVARD